MRAVRILMRRTRLPVSLVQKGHIQRQVPLLVHLVPKGPIKTQQVGHLARIVQMGHGMKGQEQKIGLSVHHVQQDSIVPMGKRLNVQLVATAGQDLVYTLVVR